jgi:hypothetical protein
LSGIVPPQESADWSLNFHAESGELLQGTLRGASDGDRICADGALFAL